MKHTQKLYLIKYAGNIGFSKDLLDSVKSVANSNTSYIGNAPAVTTTQQAPKITFTPPKDIPAPPKYSDKAHTIANTIIGEDPNNYKSVLNTIYSRSNSRKFKGQNREDALYSATTAPGQYNAYADAQKDPKRFKRNASHPKYQEVLALVNNTINEKYKPDTTYNHYYANKGLNKIQAPGWTKGQQGTQIGNQIYYTLPY